MSKWFQSDLSIEAHPKTIEVLAESLAKLSAKALTSCPIKVGFECLEDNEFIMRVKVLTFVAPNELGKTATYKAAEGYGRKFKTDKGNDNEPYCMQQFAETIDLYAEQYGTHRKVDFDAHEFGVLMHELKQVFVDKTKNRTTFMFRNTSK